MKKCGLLAVSCGSALVALNVYWILQPSMPLQICLNYVLMGVALASLGARGCLDNKTGY